MTRRTTDRPARPYYAFPWSKRAQKFALELATPRLRNGRTAPPVTYRTIAEELFNLRLVDRKVDAATVRRLVLRLQAEQAVQS